MRERIEPLEVPDTPRYFAVDIESRGRHHLRLPDYAAQEAISALARRPDVDLGTDQGFYLVGGAAIGLCWSHRGYELTTPEPASLTADALYAYSRQVQGELLDAGFTGRDVCTMTWAILDKIGSFRSASKRAREVLGNGGAATTPQPSTSS